MADNKKPDTNKSSKDSILYGWLHGDTRNPGTVVRMGDDYSHRKMVKDQAVADKELGYIYDPKTNSVRFNPTMDNYWDKPDNYNDDIINFEALLNGLGMTYSRMKSRFVNLDAFNKNKVVNGMDLLAFGRSYVFFTKPDLYLFQKDGSVNPSIVDNCRDLYYKIRKNPHVARALQSDFSDSMVSEPGKGFINLLSNHCTDISTPDMALSIRHAAKNIKGYGIEYGGDFMEALRSTEVGISFYDNRYRDVTTMLEIWVEYIEALSQGKIYKKRNYRDANIMDYAISIYIIITDETNNIVAHTGLIGCYPKTINTALLKHSREGLTAESFFGPFSYTFQVSHLTKPNSQSCVEMFNYASGFNKLRSLKDKKTEFGVDYGHTFLEPLSDISTIDSGKAADFFMHQSITSMGLAIDIGPFSADKFPELAWYDHQYTITNYWPQHVGIIMNPTDAGTMNYSLIWYSSKTYLNIMHNPSAKILNRKVIDERVVQGVRSIRSLVDQYRYTKDSAVKATLSNNIKDKLKNYDNFFINNYAYYCKIFRIAEQDLRLVRRSVSDLHKETITKKLKEKYDTSDYIYSNEEKLAEANTSDSTSSSEDSDGSTKTSTHRYGSQNSSGSKKKPVGNNGIGGSGKQRQNLMY